MTKEKTLKSRNTEIHFLKHIRVQHSELIITCNVRGSKIVTDPIKLYKYHDSLRKHTEINFSHTLLLTASFYIRYSENY